MDTDYYCLKGLFASTNMVEDYSFYDSSKQQNVFETLMNSFFTLNYYYLKEFDNNFKYIKTNKSQIVFYENDFSDSLIFALYDANVPKEIIKSNDSTINSLFYDISKPSKNISSIFKKRINAMNIGMNKKSGQVKNEKKYYPPIKTSNRLINDFYLTNNEDFFCSDFEKAKILSGDELEYEKTKSESIASFFSSLDNFFKCELNETFEWAELKNGILLIESINNFNFSVIYSKAKELHYVKSNFKYLKKGISKSLMDKDLPFEKKKEKIKPYLEFYSKLPI
ncbi:MAG: hypothetical protein PHN56_00325 [Candidatus Nanoarchaeia archaeon]|nr:hypothetical protein [Candidatus Nanoarchaeia archaeon]